MQNQIYPDKITHVFFSHSNKNRYSLQTLKFHLEVWSFLFSNFTSALIGSTYSQSKLVAAIKRKLRGCSKETAIFTYETFIHPTVNCKTSIIYAHLLTKKLCVSTPQNKMTSLQNVFAIFRGNSLLESSKGFPRKILISKNNLYKNNISLKI